MDLVRHGLTIAEGVWRCEVPGAEGANDTANVGLYEEGNGKRGSMLHT